MMKKLRSLTYSLLRKTEPYTKTDMVYLTKGGFWLGLGQVASSGAALLLAVAFANLLPKESYGLYRYVLSIAGLLAIPTLQGIDSAVTQAVARGQVGSFWTGFKAKLRWGSLSTLASLIIGGYYLLQNNHILGLSFLIVGICLPLMRSFDLYNSLLQGKKEFRFFTICNTITQLGAAGGMIILIFITKEVILIIGGYFILNTILNYLFFRWTTYKTSDAPVDPKTVPYGRHLTAILILGLVVAELDKVLIFQYLGPAELAIYALAVAPPDQIKGLLKNVPFLAFPKFAAGDNDPAKRSLFNKASRLGVTTAGLVMAYIVIAPWFFKLFFPQYLESIIYSQVLSISLIFIIPSLLLSIFMEAQSMTKELYRYNIVYNAASLAAIAILVPWFGLWGAVITRVVARFITLIYAGYLIKAR